jgi:hypothetical protein
MLTHLVDESEERQFAQEVRYECTQVNERSALAQNQTCTGKSDNQHESHREWKAISSKEGKMFVYRQLQQLSCCLAWQKRC